MKGKVVIITGGASGMGEASVRVFSKEDAKIVIADVNDDAGRAMEAEVRDAGKEAIYVNCDFSSEEDTHNLEKTTVERYGRIDSLVHFAALGGSAHSDNFQVYGSLWEFSLKDFEKMHKVNLGGTFLLVKAIAPVMIEQKSGNLVLTSSLNGLQAILNADSYTSTKGAIVALVRVIAAGLGQYNIRCNGLCPGVIATPQHGEGWKDMIGKPMRGIGLSIDTPINRAGTAEEVAYAALFLASDEASFVTGVNLPVDGGWNAI
jgi:NAD(P)-dependent dehydrogenase (short-subunit alcohol dehydrogenase family)